MFSDNVQYEILKLHAVMDPISNIKRIIPSGTYAGRELISMLEGIIELNQFEVDDQVTKTNKLKHNDPPAVRKKLIIGVMAN